MDLEPSFLIDHTEVRYSLYYYLLLITDMHTIFKGHYFFPIRFIVKLLCHSFCHHFVHALTPLCTYICDAVNISYASHKHIVVFLFL